MTHSRVGLLIAFVVVNLLWGTTFIAIRIGVQDLPPALFGGVRFVLAGLIMLAVSRLLGQRLPRTAYDWKVVVITAALMICGGNGLVTWAEQWLPSNQTALLVASSAFWLAVFGTLGPRGVPLTWRVALGLTIGFAGMLLMIWPEDGFSTEFLWAQLAALGASLCWSIAAIYLRNARLETQDTPFAAMQMLVGGALMCLLGVAVGELPRWQMTDAALGAIIYLTIMGSCVAYSAYLWMVTRAQPATLGTISYVVPVIATIGGWLVLNETLTPIQFVGMAVIVVGVATVTWPERADGPVEG